MTPILTDDERQLLLRVARAAVAASVGGSGSTSEAFVTSHTGGAFVTLSIDSVLRGCVGLVESSAPLVETIRQVALSASKDDPRFPPVDADELSEIAIEVSVLGALEPVVGPQAVVIGRHGVVVEEGARSALLLPKVAVERGWDAQVFVSNTCVKAGLRPNAWRHGARLSVFEADVFSEDETRPRGSRDP